MKGDHQAAAPIAADPATGGVTLRLLIVPRASRTEVVGIHDHRIKLRVAAPPVGGEANRSVIKFLSRALQRPRDAVRIVAGQSGRRKTVSVDGVDEADVAKMLGLS